MSRKRTRKSRRRSLKRQQRSKAARDDSRLTFEQLEPRHLLAMLTVNSTLDLPVDLTDSVITLRDSIEAANTDALVAPGGPVGNGADTIVFDQSVFTSALSIDLNSQLPTITEALTINGPGQTLLTLDAGDGSDDAFATGDGFRIFEVSDGNDLNQIDVTITGLRLTGGDTADGLGDFNSGVFGGAINSAENLTLNDSTITGNATGDGSSNSGFGHGGYGGGIFSTGSLTVTRSTISGNTTGNGGNGKRGGDGGGIYSAGTLMLIDSTISSNTTGNGGQSNSRAEVDGGSGGGISSSGSLTIIRSTVVANTTGVGGPLGGEGGSGGGISSSFGSLNVIDSTISGNTASNGGLVGGQGGGIFSYGATITRTTISGNSAAADGGGMYNIGATYVTSTIIANNTAGLSGNDISGSVDANFSLIEDIAGTTIIGAGNVTGLDPLLGPLADNGGPTLTHALLPDSPAIDAGDIGIVNPPMYDQRGMPFARIVDGNAPTDVVIDIGAFEFSTAATGVASAVIDQGGVLARPDLWRTLTVVFDQDASITADALSLLNDSLGGTAVDVSSAPFDYNATTFTATWTFAPTNPLPAAFYIYTLDASTITVGGSQLDGNGDGTGGDDFVSEHYVAIPGDANLDGQVNVLDDAFTLVGNLGTTGGATWAQGDFNADGNVNVLGDAFTLVGNLGQSVIPPATAQVSSSLKATLAAVEPTQSVPLTVVIVDQAEDDEDELVAVAPREFAEATSLELAGDQARDEVFESEFASGESFWGIRIYP